MRIPRPSLFRLAALPAAVALLTACGGGGGGGGNDESPANPTISGSSTKGLIRNGVVTMSQPGGGANGADLVLGTGRTNTLGRYDFPYTASSGPVLVCVTADAQTTVICDATDSTGCGPSNGATGDTNRNGTFDLGEALPAPADLKLCTGLPTPPAPGVGAPITPFTNIVVERARGLPGGLTASNLASAASEVNQLVGGLDVLRLEPVDLSDEDAVDDASPEALVYAALIAGVLGNSVDDLGEGEPLDLTSVVARIAEQTDGGLIDIDDLRDLLDEAREQLAWIGEVDQTGVIATLEEQADAAENSGQTTFDPEPSPNAGNSDIARARALIQNIRNTYASLDEYSDPIDAFDVDIEAAAEVVEANEATATQLETVLDAAMTFFRDDPACDDENCTITTDGITTTFATSSGTLTGSMTGTSTSTGAAVDIQITGPAGHADGATTATINIARATVSNSTARLRVTEGTATITLSEPFNAAAAEDDDPANDQSAHIFESASFDLVGSVEALSEGSVTGAATGTIRFDVVKATQCELAPTDPEDADIPQVNLAELRIDGAVSSGSQSTDLSIVAALANARSFCPLTDVSADNKPQASLTVTANLNLDAVPDARAVFTAELDDVFDRSPDADDDRTEGLIANASINLLQNNVQVFRLAAASTRPSNDSNNERVTVTVTDADSAQIVLTADINAEPVPGQIGVITVDGNRVGIIRQNDSGLVTAHYDDGTFESLF